jgi:serine/threonine-protein kinase
MPLVDESLFAPSDGAPDLVGRLFGDRYEVKELVGQGGMGWVFQATHLVMQQTVALKVMRRDVARDMTAVKRFSKEARDCSRLLHHNTIKVYDFGVSDDGYPYIVMEYLAGRSLSQVLRAEGALDPQRVVRIARQVCASLDEAHDAGLVHRDLKPANVILIRVHNDPDYVKVLDFGIAKTIMGESSETLTQSGMVIGTPKYLSPEQAKAEPIDRRSDLYALGIILYEMLTGAVPFDGPSAGALLVKHIHEVPPEVPAEVAGRPIPAGLRALVADLLAKDPEQRPATAADVAVRLEGALSGVAQSVGAPPARPAAAPVVPQGEVPESAAAPPGAAAGVVGASAIRPRPSPTTPPMGQPTTPPRAARTTPPAGPRTTRPGPRTAPPGRRPAPARGVQGPVRALVIGAVAVGGLGILAAVLVLALSGPRGGPRGGDDAELQVALEGLGGLDEGPDEPVAEPPDEPAAGPPAPPADAAAPAPAPAAPAAPAEPPAGVGAPPATPPSGPGPPPGAPLPGSPGAPAPAVTSVVVRLVSTPPGARVAAAGKELGRTPVDVPFPPAERREVTITLSGYEPAAVTLTAADAPQRQVTLARAKRAAGGREGQPTMEPRREPRKEPGADPAPKAPARDEPQAPEPKPAPGFEFELL